MPRGLSSEFITALESGNFNPITLVEFLFDSGPLRLWTGIGDLTFNSFTWTGLGRLGNISPIEETSILKATNALFTISGIPPTFISIALNEDYQERDVSMYFGLMEKEKVEYVINGDFLTAPNDLIDENFTPDPGWNSVGGASVVEGRIFSDTIAGADAYGWQSFASQTDVKCEADVIVESIVMPPSGNGGGLVSLSNTDDTLRIDLIEDAGLIKFRVIWRLESGGQDSVILATPSFIVGKNYKINMEFKQATNASSDDGVVKVWIDGVQVVNLSNVDNGNQTASEIVIGGIFATPPVSMKVHGDNVKVGVGPVSGWTDISSGTDSFILWEPSSKEFHLVESLTGDAVAEQILSGLNTTKVYQIMFEIVDAGASGVTFKIEGNDMGGSNQLGVGKHIDTFTPTISNPAISIQPFGVQTNDIVILKNISVQRAGGVPKEVIVDPNLLYRGRLDVMEDKSNGKQASLSVSSVNRLQNLENKNDRKYTAEDQKLDFLGDKGLDALTLIIDQKVDWK